MSLSCGIIPPKPKNAAEATELVAHILNTVDISLGIAQLKAGNDFVSDYTQWIAIKDLTGNRLIIADYDHRTSYLTLDLNQVFAHDKPASVPISALPYPKSVDGAKALMR